jgi:hypothetical protein
MRVFLGFVAGLLVGSACVCACRCMSRREWTDESRPRRYPPGYGAADNRRATGQEWGPETPPETPEGGPEMTGEPRPTGLSPHEPPIKSASAEDAPPKP